VRLVCLFLLVLVFAGMGLFAQHNGQTTDVSFLYWSWSGVPIWVPTAASSLIVVFVGALYVVAGGTVWRLRHRRLRRAAEELEQQNAELREQTQPDRLPAIQRWARERQVAPADEPGV
jgi:uncharacterized integral membrane protein